MKLDGKRIILVLLALLLLDPARATASESSPYALTYPTAEQGKPYCYITPFTVSHSITQPDGTSYYSGSCGPQIFRLYHSGEDERSLAAYCADPSSSIRSGANYRRINLEDASYFSDTVAGKLRALIRLSYPQVSVGGIQASANRWLRERELPTVEALQSGEAILAAQIAIWKLTGARDYTVHSLYGGAMDLSGYEETVIHTGELRQKPTDHTASNIESLYTYFCNLEAEAPETMLISDASVPRTVYSCVKGDTGELTVTVQVTIRASLGEGDALILSADCAQQLQSQTVTAPGEYSFQFPGLTERAPVTITITGEQYGADVFLFDAEGDRGASQTLIAYDRGCLPVYWERTIAPIGSVTVE